MTDTELEILREAAIGPERGPRAGEYVRVRAAGGATSENGASWVPTEDELVAEGWVDNLDGRTFMVYGRTLVWAFRFGQVQAVEWA